MRHLALQETLQGIMTQKEVRDKRKRQEKEEQMKAFMELQRKKIDMEEAVKRRKLDMEEVVQTKKIANEATNVDTKAKEVALAFMIMDLSKMPLKRRS